ncbi:DUF1552 domain-containing protein [bacterium AH-315-P07]|nr:DUF1552 domain-containing protein [bacterium AH-315-P07]
MNYLTRSHLSRRTFLRGVGAAMALPVLDAMTPAATARSALVTKTPMRMAIVYLPNGVIMKDWTPGESEGITSTRTLHALDAHRDDINLLTGLAQLNARALGDGGGDHARAAATFLTGVHPKKTAGRDLKLGISVDQVAAEFLGNQTRLPSLEMTLERGRLAGNCDSGYSCAYTNNISWRTEHTPNPPEHDPREVFKRLFGGFDTDASEDERALQRKYRKSLLDLVADDTRSLRRKLGKSDQQKLDEYLYAVRKLEQRVESSKDLEQLSVTDISAPPDEKPSTFVEYARLMFDLQVLAFRTDQTRIITMMIGREGSSRRHKEIGVDEGHHELTHHKGDEDKIEQISKINGHHLEQFAYFLDQLKSVKEEGQTLLDSSMVLCGSGISDGNRHAHYDLPLILAGKANGTLKTGRHLRYKDQVPMNNLFLSMLDRMGAHTDLLGDSTGRLEHLADL